MNTFERDGWRFSVRGHGHRDAVPFILLHGFPSDSSSWDLVGARLAAAGHRVLAPDQRGYAAEARPTDVRAYAVAELAADVLALADRAGADRFHLAGHDWGGALAWYRAAHHPERLLSLAVVSTPHPRAMTEVMWRSLQALRSSYIAAWQIPAVPEWLLTSGGGRPLRAMLRSSGLPTERADHYTERMLEPGALTAALNWYRAAARHPGDLRSVGPIRVPTLYVWSTADLALGRAAAERTEAHVEAPYQFVALDGVSHWIPETEPDQLAGLLDEHARSN